MSLQLQRCAACGKEFQRELADPYSSPYCPACDQQRVLNVPSSVPAPVASAPASSFSFPVTIAIIAVNALVFGAMVLSSASIYAPTSQQAISFGADFGPLTLNGQWWRLVTSMFVHFGILHIGLNMWCLWNLGRAAERLLGRFSYLLGYFVTGIFGSIASVWWHPQAAGAGASGAIFGLAGVLISFVYLKKTPAHLQIDSKMLGSLGTFVVYNLIFGAAIPGISNAAHIGGLVMGLVFGALLPSASVSESARGGRLSVLTAFSLIAICAAAFGARQLNADVSALGPIRELAKSGKTDQAISQLEQLTARQPNQAAAQALLGSLYYGKSRYPEALAAFEKAYAAEPANPAYQQQLGNAYLSLGEYDQAIAFFQKLTAQNPKDSRPYIGLGVAFMGKKQYESAIPAFRQAVALDPKSAKPQHALGQAQLRASRFADAQETFRRLVAQFPDDRQAKAELAFATQQLH